MSLSKSSLLFAMLVMVFVLLSCEREESEKFPNALNYSSNVTDAWAATAMRLVKETP